MLVKLFGLMVLLALASCGKQDVRTVDTMKVADSAILNHILQSANVIEQRAMFNLLSPQEKSDVWQNQFRSYRLSHILTTQQDSLLLMAESLLADNIWIEGTPERIRFTNEVEPTFRTASINAFGERDAFQVFASLRWASSGGGLTVGGNCDCSKKSSWCGPSSLQGCVRDDCAIKGDYGCGTLWLYQCNGDCF